MISAGSCALCWPSNSLRAREADRDTCEQVFARSSKFSLFDPAKEMVYIEMSKDEKSKGKAAVDLVGSQIGKSGASWLTQVLLSPQPLLRTLKTPASGYRPMFTPAMSYCTRAASGSNDVMYLE